MRGPEFYEERERARAAARKERDEREAEEAKKRAPKERGYSKEAEE